MKPFCVVVLFILTACKSMEVVPVSPVFAAAQLVEPVVEDARYAQALTSLGQAQAEYSAALQDLLALREEIQRSKQRISKLDQLVAEYQRQQAEDQEILTKKHAILEAAHSRLGD